jgi:hypothetical protein
MLRAETAAIAELQGKAASSSASRDTVVRRFFTVCACHVPPLAVGDAASVERQRDAGFGADPAGVGSWSVAALTTEP